MYVAGFGCVLAPSLVLKNCNSTNDSWKFEPASHNVLSQDKEYLEAFAVQYYPGEAAVPLFMALLEKMLLPIISEDISRIQEQQQFSLNVWLI